MFKKLLAVLLLALLAPALPSLSANYLFYLEAQGVAGYSSAQKKFIFFSMNQMEAMQKPSLGFDYIQRFAKETGDVAVLAVQARLSWNQHGDPRLEPQLYNAYLRFKFPSVDIWLGHNRPQFGLSSSSDSHGLLLQTIAMNGYGFDRDWGIGINRDFERGSLGVSLTTGSGMPLHLKGNYLMAARFSQGILSQGNFSLGLSAAYGKTLETMGYHLFSPNPMLFEMVGVDVAWLWNNLEQRFEAAAGKKGEKNGYAILWRTGISLLEEGRLKLEAQPVYLRSSWQSNCQFAVGVSLLASSDLTLRAMYHYDKSLKDSRVVFQIYYYRRLQF